MSPGQTGWGLHPQPPGMPGPIQFQKQAGSGMVT